MQGGQKGKRDHPRALLARRSSGAAEVRATGARTLRRQRRSLAVPGDHYRLSDPGRGALCLASSWRDAVSAPNLD